MVITLSDRYEFKKTKVLRVLQMPYMAYDSMTVKNLQEATRFHSQTINRILLDLIKSGDVVADNTKIRYRATHGWSTVPNGIGGYKCLCGQLLPCIERI